MTPRRVLLFVLDREDLRTSFNQMLVQSNHSAIYSFDGADGFDRFLEARPDICLVCEGTSRISGLILCRLIREHQNSKGVGIFLLSNNAGDPDLHARVGDAGADGILELPAGQAQLEAILDGPYNYSGDPAEEPKLKLVQPLTEPAVPVAPVAEELFTEHQQGEQVTLYVQPPEPTEPGAKVDAQDGRASLQDVVDPPVAYQPPDLIDLPDSGQYQIETTAPSQELPVSEELGTEEAELDGEQSELEGPDLSINAQVPSRSLENVAAVGSAPVEESDNAGGSQDDLEKAGVDSRESISRESISRESISPDSGSPEAAIPEKGDEIGGWGEQVEAAQRAQEEAAQRGRPVPQEPETTPVEQALPVEPQPATADVAAAEQGAVEQVRGHESLALEETILGAPPAPELDAIETTPVEAASLPPGVLETSDEDPALGEDTTRHVAFVEDEQTTFDPSFGAPSAELDVGDEKTDPRMMIQALQDIQEPENTAPLPGDQTPISEVPQELFRATEAQPEPDAEVFAESQSPHIDEMSSPALSGMDLDRADASGIFPLAAEERDSVTIRRAISESQLGRRLTRRILALYRLLDAVDYYQLLGVAADADSAAIQEAFHTLALEYHPDRFFPLSDGFIKERVSALYQRISEAYSVLSQAERRGNYDLLLEQRRAGPPPRFPLGEALTQSQDQSGEARTSVGRKYLRLAFAALARGDLDAAHLNLTFALGHEPDNEQLRERLQEVEHQLNASPT